MDKHALHLGFAAEKLKSYCLIVFQLRELHIKSLTGSGAIPVHKPCTLSI